MSTLSACLERTTAVDTMLAAWRQSLQMQNKEAPQLQDLLKEGAAQCAASFDSVTPGKLRFAIKLLPGEFKKLRHLKADWDGERSDPPSAKTIQAAEQLWFDCNKFAGISVPKPRIEPGADDFVEFMWIDQHSKKSLQIWIYGEDGGRCEWSSEFNGESKLGEGSLSDAANLVQTFFT
jgi:hypothetical protein